MIRNTAEYNTVSKKNRYNWYAAFIAKKEILID